MRNLIGFLFVVLLLGGPACNLDAGPHTATVNGSANQRPAAAATPTASAEQVSISGFEVVNTFPHDASAFTQGLVFQDGAFIESTGLEGHSTLRRVDLKTGQVLKKVDVPSFYFAEGMTLFGGKIYQLTWKGERGFVYDPQSFQKTGEFRYDGEGWGLTHDAESLILSDGTNQIRFLDPNTSQVKRTISVFDHGQPLEEINELEYVKGEIYANVWHVDRIARIDPQTGGIKGWIDMGGLIQPVEVKYNSEAVLNGIAYDEQGDRLFVTGKLWPKLFEIKLKQK
jgi:glutamine cyclotransferase